MILNAGLIAVLLSSCAKTYTCECTEKTTVKDNTGATSTYVEKYSYTYHAKKKYSDEACLNMVDAKSKSTGTSTYSGTVQEFGGTIECQSK